MENFRPAETSTWVNPKPGMSFRPSVPCLGGDGTKKAAGFRVFPPGAPGTETHTGWPGTRSGRERADPPGSAEAKNTTPLSGKPLRATTNDSRDQPLGNKASAPVRPLT